MTGEQWRAVPLHPYYQVSNEGRVRSIGRWLRSGQGSTWRAGQMLKPWINKDTGYLQVGLERGKKFTVHTLVAAAFMGPRPEELVVCHNDGVRTNCRVENLRYDTQSSNSSDKRKHGTDYNVNKTVCPRGHRLAVPNIVESYLREGRRKCKACNRARAKKQGHPSMDFEAESHYQYARIMTEGLAWS